MSLLSEPEAVAAAYRGTRERASALLRAGGDDASARVVPACPEWTVAELAAHMCGVCDDVLAGNMADAPGETWTAAQVARFEGQSMDEIVDHWDEVGPQVESFIPSVPARSTSQMVFDVTTHEHDLRGALGEPGGRDSASIQVGLGFIFNTLNWMISRTDLPTLEVTTPERVWTLGDVPDGEDPQVHLASPSFELFRAWAGRRSLDQIRALDWSADPTPYFAYFQGPLHPPAAPLDE